MKLALKEHLTYLMYLRMFSGLGNSRGTEICAMVSCEAGTPSGWTGRNFQIIVTLIVICSWPVAQSWSKEGHTLTCRIAQVSTGYILLYGF